ncbi:hypothetical protein LMH71_17600 [Enterovibrio norvegicus]|nr:hypothetical protein [Enterovibrio norvegicus]
MKNIFLTKPIDKALIIVKKNVGRTTEFNFKTAGGLLARKKRKVLLGE